MKAEDIVIDIRKAANDDDALEILNRYVEEETDLSYNRGYEAGCGEDDEES